jgi:hypothetical protein
MRPRLNFSRAKLLNDPVKLNALLGNIPLKRLGKPEDVASMAVFPREFGIRLRDWNYIFRGWRVDRELSGTVRIKRSLHFRGKFFCTDLFRRA